MQPNVQTKSNKSKQAINGSGKALARRRIIKWTAQESRTVAVAAYHLIAAEGYSTNIYEANIYEAVRRAQADVLPPERQRPRIKQMTDLVGSGIIPVWTELEAEKAKQKAAPVASPKKPPKTKVFWKLAEQMIIARESKRLLNAFHDMKEIEAVNKAVAANLPEDRQRKVHGMTTIVWIKELWKEVDRQAHAERAAATAAQARVEEVPKVAPTPEADKPAQSAVPNLQDCSFETLLRAFAAKIGQQLLGAIGEQIQETVMRQVVQTLQGIPLQPGAMPEGVTRIHAVPRERKPRVTVVGLINQQNEDVTRTFGDAIDFTFIKSQQGGGSGAHGGAGLLARGANADVVISMTQFTGHDVEKASKHLGDVPFVRINGSVSALKRWISQWLNGEVALAQA